MGQQHTQENDESTNIIGEALDRENKESMNVIGEVLERENESTNVIGEVFGHMTHDIVILSESDSDNDLSAWTAIRQTIQEKIDSNIAKDGDYAELARESVK